jgi:hypothetical protein
MHRVGRIVPKSQVRVVTIKLHYQMGVATPISGTTLNQLDSLICGRV